MIYSLIRHFLLLWSSCCWMGVLWSWIAEWLNWAKYWKYPYLLTFLVFFFPVGFSFVLEMAWSWLICVDVFQPWVLLEGSLVFEFLVVGLFWSLWVEIILYSSRFQRNFGDLDFAWIVFQLHRQEEVLRLQFLTHLWILLEHWFYQEFAIYQRNSKAYWHLRFWGSNNH